MLWEYCLLLTFIEIKDKLILKCHVKNVKDLGNSIVSFEWGWHSYNFLLQNLLKLLVVPQMTFYFRIF